jgi:arylsulfatase A-like enzyme
MNPALTETDVSDKPSWGRFTSPLPAVRRQQIRMVMSVDDMVQRIEALLGELQERNTLVFFLSDNGYMWGDHQRVSKYWPYTPSVEVPMRALWPEGLPGGGIDHRLVGILDIAPTIADAAELPEPPTPMDGRSLLDLRWTRDRILLELSSVSRPWASTRAHGLQYTEYYDDAGQVAFRELYDMVNDPFQLENLFADKDPTNDPSAQDVAAWSSQLQTDKNCVGAACP